MPSPTKPGCICPAMNVTGIGATKPETIHGWNPACTIHPALPKPALVIDVNQKMSSKDYNEFRDLWQAAHNSGKLPPPTIIGPYLLPRWKPNPFVAGMMTIGTVAGILQQDTWTERILVAGACLAAWTLLDYGVHHIGNAAIRTKLRQGQRRLTAKRTHGTHTPGEAVEQPSGTNQAEEAQ